MERILQWHRKHFLQEFEPGSLVIRVKTLPFIYTDYIQLDTIHTIFGVIRTATQSLFTDDTSD